MRAAAAAAVVVVGGVVVEEEVVKVPGLELFVRWCTRRSHRLDRAGCQLLKVREAPLLDLRQRRVPRSHRCRCSRELCRAAPREDVDYESKHQVAEEDPPARASHSPSPSVLRVA